MWNKIKEWFKKWYYNYTHHTCPNCGISKDTTKDYRYTWIKDINCCNSCYWAPIWAEERRIKAKEREARIEEMAEAIRRASPVAVKQVREI